MTTAVVSTRIDPRLKKRLRALANRMRRSESSLIGEAIKEYLATNEWQIALIKRRLAEARKGGSTVPHEDVKAWMKSLGTRREIARPQPKR
jgi:predicted transcriptional regulator